MKCGSFLLFRATQRKRLETLFGLFCWCCGFTSKDIYVERSGNIGSEKPLTTTCRILIDRTTFWKTNDHVKVGLSHDISSSFCWGVLKIEFILNGGVVPGKTDFWICKMSLMSRPTYLRGLPKLPKISYFRVIKKVIFGKIWESLISSVNP